MIMNDNITQNNDTSHKSRATTSQNHRTKHNNAVNVEIFAAGDGVHYPKKGHIVTIHYTAFLQNENGEIFDSVSLH